MTDAVPGPTRVMSEYSRTGISPPQAAGSRLEAQRASERRLCRTDDGSKIAYGNAGRFRLVGHPEVWAFVDDRWLVSASTRRVVAYRLGPIWRDAVSNDPLFTELPTGSGNDRQ